MSMERRGEKIGWTLGWMGGFIWVAILSVVLLGQHKSVQGVSGMVLYLAACAVSLSVAPWRHPSTRYWKLMLAPYGMFFLSIGWAVWSYGGLTPLGFNWWNLLWIVPSLSPFGFLNDRRWAESEAQEGDV